MSPHGVVVYHAALICPRLHGGMLRSRVQSSLGAPIYFFFALLYANCISKKLILNSMQRADMGCLVIFGMALIAIRMCRSVELCLRKCLHEMDHQPLEINIKNTLLSIHLIQRIQLLIPLATFALCAFACHRLPSLPLPLIKPHVSSLTRS